MSKIFLSLVFLVVLNMMFGLYIIAHDNRKYEISGSEVSSAALFGLVLIISSIIAPLAGFILDRHDKWDGTQKAA